MLLSRCGCVPGEKCGRGRPAKYGAPMTPAEQKKWKRIEQKADKQEQERRDVLAQLLKIYRRMQMIAHSDSTNLNEAAAEIEKASANIREQQHLFFKELETLEVWQLKDLLKVWTKTPDSHGRLHNERSGEKFRRGGQSEMEIIVSRRDNDTGKVVPEGHGPDNMGDDDEGHIRNPVKNTGLPAFENRLYLIARWLMRTRVCAVCGRAGTDEHIWTEWYKFDYLEHLRKEAAITPGMMLVMAEGTWKREHGCEIKTLLKKPLTFFRSVDDRNLAPGEVTQIEIEDSIRRGWVFFSTWGDRTQHLLPSQAAVRIFFRYFSDAFSTVVGLPKDVESKGFTEIFNVLGA